MRLCKINRIFAKILENLTVDFSKSYKTAFSSFFVGERVLYLYLSCCVLRQELRGRKQVSQGGVSRAGCAEKAAF